MDPKIDDWTDTRSVVHEAIRQAAELALMKNSGPDEIAGACVDAWMRTVGNPLGRCDWTYEPDLDCHIPSCAQPHGNWRCGNGPLEGDAILTGHCGGGHIEARKAARNG